MKYKYNKRVSKLLADIIYNDDIIYYYEVFIYIQYLYRTSTVISLTIENIKKNILNKRCIISRGTYNTLIFYRNMKSTLSFLNRIILLKNY